MVRLLCGQRMVETEDGGDRGWWRQKMVRVLCRQRMVRLLCEQRMVETEDGKGFV